MVRLCPYRAIDAVMAIVRADGVRTIDVTVREMMDEFRFPRMFRFFFHSSRHSSQFTPVVILQSSYSTALYNAVFF